MRHLQLIGVLAVVVFVAVVLVELRAFFEIISLVIAGLGCLYIAVFVCTKLSDQIAGSCRRWFVVLDEHRDRRYMRFGVNEIVAVHGKGGLQVVFVPAQSPRSVTTVESEPMKALPSPDFKMPVGDELLAKINQDNILLGYGENGTERRATWEQLRAILILGLSGGGKTSTAIWLIVQMLMQGGRIAIIDKHARSSESMYARVKPFSSRFNCPISDCPLSAKRVIDHIRNELDARLDGKACEYPLLLVVDEVTAIMSQIERGGEWSQSASELAGLIEALNTEGRKFKMFALCIGQAANANRSGGTPMRDTFPTSVMHRMKARQTTMLGMNEYKKMIVGLEKGQAVFDYEDIDEPFMVQVPYVTDEIIGSVVRRLDSVQGACKEGAEGVLKRRTINTENLANEPEHLVHATAEMIQRVLELKEIGISKNAIIEEVWGIKKGGNEKYKLIREEYERIIGSEEK